MKQVQRVNVTRLFLAGMVLPNCLCCTASHEVGRQIVLRRDQARITQSVAIRPGVYHIPAKGDQGAVRIIGDDITVDFQGAELVGCDENETPDNFAGRGIVIRGRNVTLKNAKVRGYKVGIYAEDAPGVTITGCDVSRNFRQRLKSTVEREDLSDWLYGHENDDNQWLRYGAGIYLFNCPGATLSGNVGRNGQNGICVSRCDDSTIIDNDMSFMSGWGIAMWRTSRCDVSNNKCDWCIRGYSHGVYSRGQDSAGIFVYEQCNDNIFAYNSATHGGDGFFLYAGNETLKKTGVGGCNRNLLYRNDFSHAAANGIECTFSDGNIFVENTLNDCHHGVWAGYSYNTVIAGNRIGDCANGVSIEHGRNNLIADNFLANCDLGVHLWWDNDVDLLESPFGKRHPNCPSSDNRILGNTFTHGKTAVRLGDDTNTVIRWNAMDGVETAVDLIGRLDGARITNNDLGGGAIRNAATGTDAISPNTDPGGYEAPREMTELAARLPPRTEGSQHAYLPDDHLRGRRYIFVDEWGPYDFSDLRVFPARVVGSARATFQVLGPAGAFKVDRVTGDVEVQPLSGELPGTITVSATRNGWQPFRVHITADRRKLEAVGGLLQADWTVKFYRWDPADDPRTDQDKWRELIAQTPIEERTLPAIDFAWGGRAPSANVPRDHFGTVATTTVNLPAGTWVVRTISDDGIRVWVDGRRIIDDWTWHPPKENVAEIELADGTHAIRVEHFEIDGFAQLQLRLEPAR